MQLPNSETERIGKEADVKHFDFQKKATYIEAAQKEAELWLKRMEGLLEWIAEEDYKPGAGNELWFKWNGMDVDETPLTTSQLIELYLETLK